MSECSEELQKLESVQSEFTENFNKKMVDIEEQFQAIYDAIKRRQSDSEKWRKREHDEGLHAISTRKETLKQRLSALQSLSDDPSEREGVLSAVPSMTNFSLHRFTRGHLRSGM